MEHLERVTGVVTQALQSIASKFFEVTPDKVYMWQYNGDPLTSEHFVYLLNDIAKALVCVTLTFYSIYYYFHLACSLC